MGRAAYGSQCRQPAKLPHRGGGAFQLRLPCTRTCAVAGSPAPAWLACRGTGQALARQSSTWVVARPLAHPAAITHLRPTCAASSRHAVMATGAHSTGAAGTAAVEHWWPSCKGNGS